VVIYLDYKTEIVDMLKITPKNQLVRKIREIRDEYRKHLENKFENDPNSETKVKEELKKFADFYRSRKEMYTGMQGGRRVLDKILRMGVTDETGLRYDAIDLVNTRLGKVKITGSVNQEIMSNEYKKTLDAYAETLEEDKKNNLKANLTKIKRTVSLDRKRTVRNVRTKTVSLDINKYLGATDLSKDEVRKSIYDYWEGIAKRYTAFEDALEKVFKVARAEFISEFQGPRRKETESLEAFDDLFYFEMKEGAFGEKMAELERRYSGVNFEYLFDFTKMRVPATRDPKMRLVEALDRIILANKLVSNEKKLIQMYQDDESTEDAQRAWEADLIEFAENKIEDSKREQSGIDSIEDTKYKTEDDDDVYEFEADIEKVIVDPLLSFELIRGKKLLALDEESQTILRETLDAFKDEEVDLDMKTNLRQLLSEVRDTLIMEKDKYVLPISVIENSDFKKFISTEKLVSANKKEPFNDRKVMQTLYDFFDELNAAISDRRFGFAGGVRSTGRGGTLGGALPPRSEARNTAIQRLVEEPKRQVPVNIQARGKMKEGTKRFLDAIKELLEAFDDYYVSPLYAGKLPIEIPSYARSSGVKSLTVYLREMGGITVKGSLYEKLSTRGRASISATTLKDIADFLIKFKSPNVKVTEALIDEAEDCAEGLTALFNNREKNRNYCAAVLMHFMEQTDDYAMQGNDFFDKTIKSRSDAFNADYKKSEPVPAFALPYFLDQHQSLLTKTSAKRKQYNRLLGIVKEVEDDLPIHLTKLLKAHDEIRKALGKQVIYGFLPRSFEGYETIVDNMYKNEQIDLSHLEVDNIIKSEDAHSNISKEYGITEEQVYLIKANFR